MPERRLSFILLSTFLTLFLGGWVLSSALDRTIGEPAQAKDLLNRSGIYQAVVPAQLSEAGRSNPALANLPLDHPEVQKILSTSLGGKQVQTEGDKAVDSLYAWLEGTSPKPDITITAKPDASALAASLSNLAAAHAAKLPTCAPGDAAAVAAITADPLSAKCLPAGVTAETVRGFVSGEVATNPALSAPV
ncbi:MAG TPA: hypothetical protein VK978_02980, partial [Candidatus Saccharimonadales bacterium]|nr:hypothetical protein [Candidatus Saccharimonadales bacterium]